MPTDQEYLGGIKRALEAGDHEAADFLRNEWKTSVMRQSVIDNDPLRDTNWLGKAAINLGAGFDTAWQGAKQLVGQGMSDEELKYKRERDQAAADATTGGGLLQVAGEMAPGLALGAGAGAVAGRALPLAARAVSALPKLQKAALVGAAGGAADSAIRPYTSDESRLAETAKGTIAGAIAGPVASKVIDIGKAGGKAILSRASRAVAESRGEDLAARSLRKELGEGTEQTISELAGAPSRQLPLSSAATINHPVLGKLEVRSRNARPEDWMSHDDTYMQAMSRALDEATSSGSVADALRAKRTADYQKALSGVEAAVQAAPAKAARGIEALPEVIELSLANSQYGSKAGRMMGEIRRAFDGDTGIRQAIARGDTSTAVKQLMELRSDLASSAGRFADMGEAKGEAGRKMTQTAIKEIDNLLDFGVHSKMQGRMSGANRAFAAASPDVDAATLAQQLRGQISQRPARVVASGAAPGMSYDVNPTVLASLRSKAVGEAAQNPSPIARDMAGKLTRIEDEAALAERASGGKVGSTDPEMSTPYAPGISGHALRATVNWLRGMSSRDKEKAMAKILQDPQYAARVLRQAQDYAKNLGKARGGVVYVTGAAAHDEE